MTCNVCSLEKVLRCPRKCTFIEFITLFMTACVKTQMLWRNVVGIEVIKFEVDKS